MIDLLGLGSSKATREVKKKENKENLSLKPNPKQFGVSFFLFFFLFFVLLPSG